MKQTFWIGVIVLLYFLNASHPSPVDLFQNRSLSNDFYHCTGFPLSFTGCWEIKESEQLIFLNNSCMHMKNETLCGQILCSAKDFTLLPISHGSSLKATFRITQDPSVVHMTTVRCHQIKETAEPEYCGTPNTLPLVKTEIGEDCSHYLHRSDKVKHQDFLPSDKKDRIHAEETHDLKRVVRAIRENIQGVRKDHEKSRRNRYRSKSKTNKRNAPTPKPGVSKGRGAASVNETKSNKGPHVASTKRQESASSRAGINRKPGSKMNKGKSTAPKLGARSKMNHKKPKTAGPRSRSMEHGTIPTNESKSSKGPISPQVFAQKADSTAKKVAADTKQRASKSPRRRTGKLNKNVSSASKGKFEKNLKSIEKDIAKQQKKERKNSSQQSSKANLKGRDRSFGSTHAKKRKHPFAKNADNAAAKLAKKEKHVPSLPRHKSTKRLPSGAKQEEFEKRMNTVAKDFAKNDKDSPVAFDRLVSKVAKDLAKSSPKTNQKGDRVFIPRGKTVTLDCVRDEESHSPISPLKTKWTKDGQKLAEGRYQVTSLGDLKIEEVESHDTGIFRCDAVVTNKEAKRESVTRLHKVMVYRRPTLSYYFVIKFKTSGCNSVRSGEALSYFRSKVCAKNSCALRDVVCKCPAAGKNLFIEGKVTLGMEYKSPSVCSTSKCHTEAMKRELEKRAEKLKDFVSEYKSGSGKYGRISNVVYDFIYYCESGYEQNNLMCTPCYPGFYSPPGDPACHRCRKDTYQDNFGSSRCLKCPDGGKTKKPGATSAVTCRGQLKVQVGTRKVKLDRFMLYVGASVGVLGLIFMIATCVYLAMKIKQNPDVSKKEVVKGEMTKAKKKAGESARKAKRKAKSLKKKKSEESKSKSEGESDVEDEDEENENNSNLANVPLLNSSQPKYDKNSRNLRKIKEEGTKQTRVISSKANVNKNNKSSVEEEGTKQTSIISSKGNVNKNNRSSVEEGTQQTRIISSRCNVNKNYRSSVPVFTSSDADFVPRNTGRPAGLKGSVSESTASNIRAARNAALHAKSNVNNCNAKLSRENVVLGDSKPSRRSHSRSTVSSRISSRVANTRAILTEGKAKYGNDAYCRLIAKVSQDNRRTSSPKCANSTPTPRSLVNSPASTSIYSTPPDKLYPVQHADSWYTTEWDPSEGSTTTCVTVEQTKSSNSRLSSQVEDTDSLRTGDSWHDSYQMVP